MSKEKEIETEVSFGEYKGSPTIMIHELDEHGNRKPYPFTFGVKKAKMVIKHIEDIEAFVEDN